MWFLDGKEDKQRNTEMAKMEEKNTEKHKNRAIKVFCFKKHKNVLKIIFEGKINWIRRARG